MKKENDCCGNCQKVVVKRSYNGNSDAIYGLGVIGALFYFLPGTTTLIDILWGIGKSVFWPAILMHKLLGFLNM